MTAIAPAQVPFPMPASLDDGVVALRPWRVGDAGALAAAWADPEVGRWTAVPPRAGVADAERWVRGWEARRRRGLALDLVVVAVGDPTSDVLGEVGMVPAGPAEVQLGWWVAAGHRRRSVATRAVGLVAAWCRDMLGLEPVAEIDPANLASVRVAERAGVTVRRAAR